MAKPAKLPKHETPTLETQAQGTYKEEHITASPGSPKRIRRVDGSELDRMLMVGLVTESEHTTLARFQNELYDAGLVFCPRAGVSPPSGGGQASMMGDRAFTRASQVNRQMLVLKLALGENDLDRMVSMLTMDTRLQQPVLAKAAARTLEPLYSR